MSNVTTLNRGGAADGNVPVASGIQNDVVSMTVAGQLFGIPVMAVQDVLGPQRITRVPLAPAEVAGSLNLRGRIVTAIDVRRRLRLGAREKDQQGMNVVVECDGELYSLIVDTVGEVLSLPTAAYERNPATLDQVWREVSCGIYRLKEGLLLMVDVGKLIGSAKAEAA